MPAHKGEPCRVCGDDVGTGCVNIYCPYPVDSLSLWFWDVVIEPCKPGCAYRGYGACCNEIPKLPMASSFSSSPSPREEKP